MSADKPKEMTLSEANRMVKRLTLYTSIDKRVQRLEQYGLIKIIKRDTPMELIREYITWISGRHPDCCLDDIKMRMRKLIEEEDANANS